jgi:hypothetical protein
LGSEERFLRFGWVFFGCHDQVLVEELFLQMGLILQGRKELPKRPFVYAATTAFQTSRVNNTFGNNKMQITVYMRPVKTVSS